MDVARWGLGLGFPNKISAVGGHLTFDDDQETPNVLNCAFEYSPPEKKRTILEFEGRHWIANHEAGIGAAPGHADICSAPLPKLGPLAGTHNTIGYVFYGSQGYLALSDRGYRTQI